MYLSYIQEDADETMKSKSRKRQQTRGRDPQKACPLTGCDGKAVNLKRHFIQVHRKMRAGVFFFKIFYCGTFF